jgi:hypothetical protein
MSRRSVLLLGLLAAAVVPTACSGPDVASLGFDLSTCLVPRQTLVPAGFARDGLPTVDSPVLLDPAEVAQRNSSGRGKFLLGTDRVIGVRVGDQARAYPIRWLRWHEVVNDTLGGEPVVVTYSPLCDSVMAARRRVGGTTLSFGASGLLASSNPLLHDRRDEASSSSLWSQLQGRAVAGPAAARGQRLELLPSALISWQQWLDRHPDTTVMAPDPARRRLYKRDPYNSYFGSDVLHFPVEPLPPTTELQLKDRVVAIDIGDATGVFALPYLSAAVGAPRGSHPIDVGGVPLVIHFDRAAGTAWVEPPADLTATLAARHAFWFAWFAQHPETGRPLP